MKIILVLGILVCTLPLWGNAQHIVQKNETLGGIAKRYGVSVSALQAINGISNPNLLFVGKKLKIPDGNLQKIPYTIRKGDSLGSIAKRFGVKQSTLIEFNQIKSPNLIRIGQKLVIPLQGGSTTAPSLLSSSTISALNKISPRLGRWKRIVIHHSATPVDDAMNMHRVHKARGMKNGLAYHFVIENGTRGTKNGDIYIGKRWENQLHGGHMKLWAHNQVAIGICLIGNFEKTRPKSRQLDQLEALIDYLQAKTGIPGKNVTTHKLMHPKHTLCPGRYFPSEQLKQMVR